MSIASFIAKTGENPNFIAFAAHSGVAAFTVSRFPTGIIRYIAAGAAVVAAAAKEFIFDFKYEQTPLQTFKDSVLDFAGYITGILAGLLIP